MNPQQHYVYITSASTTLHTDNKPHDFTITLSTPINLNDLEDWSVAVTELELVPGATSQSFCMCSDLCSDSHIGEKSLPVLRRFYPFVITGSKKQVFTFPYPYYVKLKQKFIQKFRIYITDDKGLLLSVGNSTLKATLHFRRNSPWHFN